MQVKKLLSIPRNKLIGGRVLKTGLAVFITSSICMIFNWPAVFAVITSIVTIEPTVSNSIRKGLVRFPASAIGSLYAVSFILIFGQSPITYTGAAVLTIVTCSKLKLREGLLVATLTAVAMIEVIHDNFMFAFFLRLGTTTIGLLVSTVVNFLILPPNYTNTIQSNIDRAIEASIDELKLFAHKLSLGQNDDSTLRSEEIFDQLHNQLILTEELLRFQRSEAYYHPITKQEKRELLKEQKQLRALKLMHYHIGNLNSTEVVAVRWKHFEMDYVIEAIHLITDTLANLDTFDEQQQKKQVDELMNRFWKIPNTNPIQKEGEDRHYFHSESVILYELLSIFQLTEQLINER